MNTIAISSTNPCHLYPMAEELLHLGSLICYYSGYPKWRLKPPAGFPLRTHSPRTITTYLINRLPTRVRPPMQPIFNWQDQGLDEWVSKRLVEVNDLHAMPGQALRTFQAANRRGIRTILNHAHGPLEYQHRAVRQVFLDAGKEPPGDREVEKALVARHREEYEIAARHCVASTIVRDQLVEFGVPGNKIWVVPYGADERIFKPGPKERKRDPYRIVFAGQLVLRKGIGVLLESLRQIGTRNWSLDCYGPANSETDQLFRDYQGTISVQRHGKLSYSQLASVFQTASVLVLPSLEEGFGLVVPQALACGCPCIVSDAVGAKDLILPGRNGDIFETGNSEHLASVLVEWSGKTVQFDQDYSWKRAAVRLLEVSEKE